MKHEAQGRDSLGGKTSKEPLYDADRDLVARVYFHTILRVLSDCLVKPVECVPAVLMQDAS